MAHHMYQSLSESRGDEKNCSCLRSRRQSRNSGLVRATVCVMASTYESGLVWQMYRIKNDSQFSVLIDPCLDLTFVTLTLPLILGIGARFDFSSTYLMCRA